MDAMSCKRFWTENHLRNSSFQSFKMHLSLCSLQISRTHEAPISKGKHVTFFEMLYFERIKKCKQLFYSIEQGGRKILEKIAGNLLLFRIFQYRSWIVASQGINCLISQAAGKGTALNFRCKMVVI